MYNALMTAMSTKSRKSLPSSAFGIPSERKYPEENKAHAANAKSRATQQVNNGNLSPSTAATIKAKANRVLNTGNTVAKVAGRMKK